MTEPRRDEPLLRGAGDLADPARRFNCPGDFNIPLGVAGVGTDCRRLGLGLVLPTFDFSFETGVGALVSPFDMAVFVDSFRGSFSSRSPFLVEFDFFARGGPGKFCENSLKLFKSFDLPFSSSEEIDQLSSYPGSFFFFLDFVFFILSVEAGTGLREEVRFFLEVPDFLDLPVRPGALAGTFTLGFGLPVGVA